MVSLSYFALITSAGFVFLGVLYWNLGGWREGLQERILGVNRIGGIIGINLVPNLRMTFEYHSIPVVFQGLA